jgi:Carbohydrate family 9 binding domain-like
MQSENLELECNVKPFTQRVITAPALSCMRLLKLNQKLSYLGQLILATAFIVCCLSETNRAFAQDLPASPSPSPSASPTKVSATPRGAIVLPPEKASPVKLPRFSESPVIDGKLADEVWKQAVKLKDFQQVQPGDNIAPSQPTEVYLGDDSKFLYVAFHCYDDPSKVRANIPKRDNIFDDDYVGILFDTFNDHRKAYEFNFNPLGVQADGIWTDGQNEDFNPDIVMESKGMVTEDVWTASARTIRKNRRKE